MTESGPAERRQRLHVIEIAVLAGDAELTRLCQRLADAITAGVHNGQMLPSSTMSVYAGTGLPRSVQAQHLAYLNHMPRADPETCSFT